MNRPRSGSLPHSLAGRADVGRGRRLAPRTTARWCAIEVGYARPQINRGRGKVIAQEIVDDLEAALEQFKLIAADLGAEAGE